MPRMTKAQGRRRLKEAEAKFKKVYMAHMPGQNTHPVQTKDMEAVTKIVDRCINRIR